MDIAVGASRGPSTSPSADIKTAQSAVRQGRFLTLNRTGDCAAGACESGPHSPLCGRGMRKGHLLTRTRTGDCADHYVGPLVTARKKAGDVGESGPHSPLCGRGMRKWSAQSPVRKARAAGASPDSDPHSGLCGPLCRTLGHRAQESRGCRRKWSAQSPVRQGMRKWSAQSPVRKGHAKVVRTVPCAAGACGRGVS